MKDKIMKDKIIPQFTGYSISWILAFNLLALLVLTSCSSSDSTTPFTPANSLEGKVLVLGAQEDTNGNLVIYAHGTDLTGTVLTVADLQTATVNVDALSYTNNDLNLTIAEVEPTDDFLSLSLVTDWSNSTNGELGLVAGIFTQVLDNLPLVYEAQVITFSDDYEMQQTWTDNLTAIKDAVAAAHSVRNLTALYDTMGVALEGDSVTTGLVERCRTAHVQVVFTDGKDNFAFSGAYSDSILETIVNADKTVSIMLGTSDAKKDVLDKLAGEHGAVVQVVDPSSLGAEVEQWVASLQNIVKITVGSAIYATGQTVSITMGAQTVAVFPNTHDMTCTP